MPTTALIFGERSITGSLTGTVAAAEDTLEYSVLQRIRPTIERFPLDDAANAYGRMMASQARFRNVLVM